MDILKFNSRVDILKYVMFSAYLNVLTVNCIVVNVRYQHQKYLNNWFLVVYTVSCSLYSFTFFLNTTIKAGKKGWYILQMTINLRS